MPQPPTSPESSPQQQIPPTPPDRSRRSLHLLRYQSVGVVLIALAVLAWRLTQVPIAWWFPAGWWRLW